ncbi:MAG: cytochrome P460 family protein [Desulfobulbaceae bacterium]|jgi:hypothetical protein|nr:cytochrome P460 family protein [Desulfobulbaceae bacterium]MDY0351735.1 cytochrome P460 family protein [Desulfobulbaceae bacterium]
MKNVCLLLGTITLCFIHGWAPAWADSSEPQLPKDLTGYRHIHSLVINDKESPLFGFHHFYINETGWETFKNQGPFPYPEGTIFLGAVYKVEQDGELYNEGSGAVYTMMKKDPAAAETGGWLFASFTPDGKPVEQDVKTGCFSCHQPLKDRDHVFSSPLNLSLPLP